MKANILEGVYVRVSGEAGSTNGLSWRILEGMFDHLQELITLLAKFELDSNRPPNLKEFDIEIFDFKHGSAVPAFRLKPPSPILALFPDLEEQKTIVAQKFDDLMALANEGRYEQFFPNDGLPEVRYAIAEELNGFITSAGNSPISIVQPPTANGQINTLYEIKRFTKYQSDNLLKPPSRRQKQDEPRLMLGLVRRTGHVNRVVDLYQSKDATLAIAPTQIVLENRIYHLTAPLNCTVHKEEDHFIVQNEILDLYAVGDTLDEAEHDLYHEFDASYTLLQSLPDDQLSERLIGAKGIMKAYIKEITSD